MVAIKTTRSEHSFENKQQVLYCSTVMHNVGVMGGKRDTQNLGVCITFLFFAEQ